DNRGPAGVGVLVATGLAKTYGKAVAVHDFTATIPAGRIVGLEGNNGAGKTTVLKMLCGDLEPTSGQATINGSPTTLAEARRALLHDPDVLLLDEPASGLDPATRRELDTFLSQLRDAGKAILLSAHNLTQVEQLCDDILLLHAGRVAARGTLTELRAQWGTHR